MQYLRNGRAAQSSTISLEMKTPFSTPRRKLLQVNRELGVKGIGNQQDTTRFIYDEVTNAGTFGRFFEDFNKTIFQCNLDTNKLDSMESMVVNEIIIKGGGGDEFTGAALLNVYIGNDQRVKNYNIQIEATQGFQSFPISSGNNAGFVSLPMLTSIVIPPQVQFYATLELSGTAGDFASGVQLGFKGYGKIFKPQASF